MILQSKKSFAMVDFEKCDPNKCNPEKGGCASVSGCTHKVIKQIDSLFELPMVFQDLCMGCWDCIEACPLDAIEMRHVTTTVPTLFK
jgi:translation initiation factor RLI1